MAQSRYYTSTAQPTVLLAGVTPSSTVINVQAVTGFPLSFPYVLALDYGTPGEELVLVTTGVGTSLTVTRAFDSTSAASHSAGAAVRHTWCGADGNDSRAHEGSVAAVHGVAGTIVGTTDTQTLTNKTLTNPTINAATMTGNIAGTPSFTGTVNFNNGLQVNNLSGLFTRALSTSVAIRATVSGDTSDRFAILAGGDVQWGTGAAVADVVLRRQTTNQLLIDSTTTGSGQLRIIGNQPITFSSTTHGFQIGNTAGINLRMSNTTILAASNGVASPLTLGGSTITATASTAISLGGTAVTVTGTAAGSVPMTVNAISGQTANIENWQVNSATVASIDSAGNFTSNILTGSAPTPNAGWSVVTTVLNRAANVSYAKITFQRTGAPIAVPASGTVPSGIMATGFVNVFAPPSGTLYFHAGNAGASGGASLNSLGNITLENWTPSSTIGTGDQINITWTLIR